MGNLSSGPCSIASHVTRGIQFELSNEQKPGCFGYIGEYTTHCLVGITLPETNELPLKIGHPKRKRSYSNHPFSGAKMLVSGRVFKSHKKKIIPWVVPPSQDASHHQDYSIFSRESQPKPSFATGILGGGTTQYILTFNHKN